MTPRVVIDQTSPEWDKAVQRALGLLVATKAEASLVELEHTVNDIVASENALNELANLVFALSLIGALTTELLSVNAGADFGEMLKRIEWLIAESVRRQHSEE